MYISYAKQILEKQGIIIEYRKIDNELNVDEIIDFGKGDQLMLIIDDATEFTSNSKVVSDMSMTIRHNNGS